MKIALKLTALAAGALVVTNVVAQTSDAPQITASAFASGGGTASAGDYTFTHSLGEAIAGSSSAGDYTLVAGFLTSATDETDVDLKLTVTPLPVVLTENISRNFTLSVSNNGTSHATALELSINLPVGLRVMAATNSAGTCQVTLSNVTCSVVSLASNASFTVELAVRANFLPEQADEFENLSDLTAVVSALETDLNPDDNARSLPVTVWQQLDFGDATTGFPVSLAENGARHRYWPGYRLGALWDRQGDGYHSTWADWDDTHLSADEDGVVFLNPLVAGAPATVVVNSSFAGFLDVWADFNNDGDWADAGEQIFTSQPLALGNNTLTFTVPATSLAGNITTRWRASATGGLNYTGYGAEGEVEDHLVVVRAMPCPRLKVSNGMATVSFQTESQVNYLVEYTDSLSTPDWQPLMRVTGSGQDVVVADSTNRPMRFYRIRIE